MTNDEIKAVQASQGIYLVERDVKLERRRGGELVEVTERRVKSIQPGKEPPEGATVYAVKIPKGRPRTLEEAKRTLRLAQRAAEMSDEDLEKLEDEGGPAEAGELRRSLRCVQVVSNG